MSKLFAGVLALLFAGSVQAQPQAPQQGQQRDPHYNELGFFDIHVCNWQENPHFFMALFSTEFFDSVAKVSVFTPSGDHLGDLNLTKFRAFKNKAGKDKRAFIDHFPVPAKNVDGWYRAEVQTKDGRTFSAQDYVIDAVMPMPTGMKPEPGAENVELPDELRWNPIPGARFYQVFIRDKWDDKLIFKTDVITTPFLKLPPGLIQPGGSYSWVVHARDVNEHALLGDFNHGTTPPAYTFTVKD